MPGPKAERLKYLVAQLPMARGENDGFGFLDAFTRGVIAEVHKRSLPYAGRPITNSGNEFALLEPRRDHSEHSNV